MAEFLFAFLFKYRPLAFEQGEFRFAAPGLAAGLAAAAAAVIAILTYARLRGSLGARDRAALTALRIGALAVALFCLARPVLVLKAAVPQQNFLGILLDDSRSMRIADRDGTPRSAYVQSTFGQADSQILAALSDRFLLRFFRFSSSAERVPAAAELAFTGTRTRLGDALQRAREDLAGLPLSGLVMVTDGADTSESSIEGALLALRADGIPVFTVGVGREALAHDIQIGRIGTPRSVLKGASLAVDVVVTQRGYQGSVVSLNVEDAGRLISTQEVTLPADGEPAAVRIRFAASEAGARVFRFRVPPQPGEEVTENNARDVLVEVEDRREKILYFEGEPRFEVKFIRRAVADDRNLQLTVLQRTAEAKYLRLDVDSPDELVAGFPKTRDDLFGYRAIVLGSIEAGAFTGDQLRMIAEFVDRRGGGLLMLGGHRAFAEGQYAGTPIADVLPVVLEPGRQAGPPSLARLRVRPTRAGAAHPATQIAATEAGSARRWDELPEVTSVNPLHTAKPGATILLSGIDQDRRERIVLASQRYGRGKALAFAVQDSLVWQMHAGIAVEDLTHESFWRQLLRWLVDGVPDKVRLEAPSDVVEPGAETALLADVVDSAFVEVNDARVVATVTGPSGRPVEVPMLWTGRRNGEYRANLVPAEPGLHEVRVEAVKAGVPLGVAVGHVRVGAGDSEYFDAGMRAPLLQRIAEETGGRFYRSDDASALAEDIAYAGRGVTTVEERDLWDMPAALLLLLGLVLGEWGYRRARRLA